MPPLNLHKENSRKAKMVWFSYLHGCLGALHISLRCLRHPPTFTIILSWWEISSPDPYQESHPDYNPKPSPCKSHFVTRLSLLCMTAPKAGKAHRPRDIKPADVTEAHDHVCIQVPMLCLKRRMVVGFYSSLERKWWKPCVSTNAIFSS